jgi:hypothetical protein
MAQIKKKGNSLTSLQLQPGWQIEDDGFGLMTSRLTFKCDASIAGAKKPKEKEAHPEDGRLLCHRSSYTSNESGVATITAEYVGISSGSMTKVQVSGSVALTTQSIKVHPNFAIGKVSDAGKPLKDLGWDEQSQSFPETNADAVTFGLVGIKSYLSPELQYTGSYYTSSQAVLMENMKMTGKTFQTIPGGENVIIPPGLKSISPKHIRFGLVTGVNYEQFAHIYKVNFTFRVSNGGWHSYVYDTHN